MYSNLPVHYSTKEGRYNYQIQFNTFGTKSTTLKHKFDYYIFEGGKVDITYGENFDVYYIMLNKTNLSSRLQHCGAADHLGHGTAEQLQKEGILNQFLQSACATQHNCKSDGYNITCTRYKDSNGLWRYYNPGWTTTNSYTTYRQLRECIESNVIKTEGKVVFDGSTTYKCTYKVKNEIMRECDTPSCKPNDLNVIFRTISLNNPFPGQSGNGRAPGDNWNKTSLVNSFITNNRGVQTENLYKDRSPLYSITLTPALIKQIRNYNDKLDTKRVSYYTTKSGRIDGTAGYSDFDLDCNANGKNCKSNFIRNSVENYDFSKYFSGCGINGKAHGLKCNSSDSW